jgi:hypothetical protein
LKEKIRGLVYREAEKGEDDGEAGLVCFGCNRERDEGKMERRQCVEAVGWRSWVCWLKGKKEREQRENVGFGLVLVSWGRNGCGSRNSKAGESGGFGWFSMGRG